MPSIVNHRDTLSPHVQEHGLLFFAWSGQSRCDNVTAEIHALSGFKYILEDSNFLDFVSILTQAQEIWGKNTAF